MRDFFYFVQILSYLQKDLVSTPSFFTFLLITQYPNKIKKNPKHPFLDIITFFNKLFHKVET